MMLLFTPGQFGDGSTSKGFYIRLGDGSTAEIAFDSKIDDLVIMLGDGVNQYINNHHSKNGKDAHFLRAVPHALALDTPTPSSSSSTTTTILTTKASPRLWYGRMVLPPPEAIHPSGNGKTFEELRSAMIRGDEDSLYMGCSSPSMVARELLEHSATDDGPLACDESVSMLCWMKCMEYVAYDVDPDSCGALGEELGCANDDDETWEIGIHSSDYYLRCLEPHGNETGTASGDGHGDDDTPMDHSGGAGAPVVAGWLLASSVGAFVVTLPAW